MTQLFNNEYFGIGLIVTIAFLTILFIIVLIMALKDARKRKDEITLGKEEKNATPSQEFAFKEEEPVVSLEVGELKEENKEVVLPTTPEPQIEITATPKEEVESVEKKEEEDFKTADFSFEDLKEQEPSVEKEPTVNIDFAALAESLKSELEAETKKEEPPKVEVKPEDLFDNQKPDIPSIDLEELKRFANELQQDEEKPLLQNEEDTIKIVDTNNTQENVYLNKEEEKVVKEEKVYGPPVKMKVPTMEMPKFASAPTGSVKVSNVEPVEDKKEEVITPSFESIENETFSLK